MGDRVVRVTITTKGLALPTRQDNQHEMTEVTNTTGTNTTGPSRVPTRQDLLSCWTCRVVTQGTPRIEVLSQLLELPCGIRITGSDDVAMTGVAGNLWALCTQNEFDVFDGIVVSARTPQEERM